ncbi:MAG: hypothetical protein ACLUE1_08040 [Adlercreutzia equolifaciens]
MPRSSWLSARRCRWPACYGDGERIATLRPTCFLEEAGAAAPITLGGQALLADAGID